MLALPAGSFTLMPQMMVTGYTVAYLFGCSLISQLSIRLIDDPNDYFWKVKDRDVPAAYCNETLGTHGYIQTKNIRLHYVENGNRSNPLMLMVHGYPQFWYSWRHQLVNFSSDYWVVALDMRGFGDSEKPLEIEKYKADIIAEDLKDVITGLGKDKCILMGHDWGGIISWYFVLTYPQYIHSYIILNSVHPYVLLTYLNTNLAQIKRSWYMFFYQFPYLPELRATVDDMAYLDTVMASNKIPNPITREDMEMYKCNYGRKGAWTTALNIYRANLQFETSHRLLGRGNASDFPHCLMLFGTGDKVLDLMQSDSSKMAANIQLEYIPNATHFVHEDAPTDVNAKIWTFLTSLKGHF